MERLLAGDEEADLIDEGDWTSVVLILGRGLGVEGDAGLTF